MTARKEVRTKRQRGFLQLVVWNTEPMFTRRIDAKPTEIASRISREVLSFFGKHNIAFMCNFKSFQMYESYRTILQRKFPRRISYQLERK